MDSSYRPQSPDLSDLHAPPQPYAPQSPDLSGLRPHTPDVPGNLPGPAYNSFGHHHSRGHHGGSRGNGLLGGFAGSPTSFPQQQQQQQPQYSHQPQQSSQQQQYGGFPGQQYIKSDTEQAYYPHHQELQIKPEEGYNQPFFKSDYIKAEPEYYYSPDGSAPNIGGQAYMQPQQYNYPYQQQQQQFPPQQLQQQTMPRQSRQQQQQQQQQNQQPLPDPTLGVTLRTSFPVARIKRIMQADEEIGKVAQVTPHVVSRALELFMIKLITASAEQARGGAAAAAPASKSGNGAQGAAQKRILAQHMKKAVQAEEKFDFLVEIAGKVPDAPVKAKKEGGNASGGGGAGGGSDSEDAAPKAAASGTRRGGRKKRDDDDDDF